MQNEFLYCSVLRVTSGPRVTLACGKNALNPPVVYSTDRSKAVVLVLVLFFVALWFILPGDLFYALCNFVFVFFSHLGIAITSLGEERASLGAFRTFFFCLICACLVLSVSSSSWCLGRAAVCDCGTPWTFLLLFNCGLVKSI